MSSPGPLPIPANSISSLLLTGRSLLLDPTHGPSVPAGKANVADRLQDVRIYGRGQYQGQQVGTEGWIPGQTGYPFAILGAARKKLSYKETGRGWEDWDVILKLGLIRHYDGADDLFDWAAQWDAELTQWFPFNYRMGDTTGTLGDIYWLYNGGEIGQPWVQNKLAFYGNLHLVMLHNVVPITFSTGGVGYSN